MENKIIKGGISIDSTTRQNSRTTGVLTSRLRKIPAHEPPSLSQLGNETQVLESLRLKQARAD